MANVQAMAELKHRTQSLVQGLSDLKSEPDLLVEIIKSNSSALASAQHSDLSQVAGGGPFAAEWPGTRR